MKKRIIIYSTAVMLVTSISGKAEAALTEIGTASYGGVDYKLIHDDDQHLTWLDYSNAIPTSSTSHNYWQTQIDWAQSLNSPGTLTYNLYSGSAPWDNSEWRLPTVVDGPNVYDYVGDPDGNGQYDYFSGYNLANSEMGHLFYTELNNNGLYNTDGTSPSSSGLTNSGPFEQLLGEMYFSSTEYSGFSSLAWEFDFGTGEQYIQYKSSNLYAVAVRPDGQSQVPIPGAVWLLLTGLIGIKSFRAHQNKIS